MNDKNQKRTVSILKQGIWIGFLTFAIIFGPDIRASVFNDRPSSAPVSAADLAERVLKVELQNKEHVRLAGQISGQSEIMSGLQQAQAQLIIQVKILSEVVSAMQQREFARLEQK